MATPNGTFDRVASGYDRGMKPLEQLGLSQLRRQLLVHARGQILEIGIGTGASLCSYPVEGCLFGLDESSEMVATTAARARSEDLCVRLSRASIERLPFSDGAFDTVVGSLVLCSVVDLPAALSEIRRVLRRPAGRLLLLEHTRPDAPLFGRLVDLANRPWYALNGRCHVNRRTGQAVAQAGFHVEQIESRMGGLLRLLIASPSS